MQNEIDSRKPSRVFPPQRISKPRWLSRCGFILSSEQRKMWKTDFPWMKRVLLRSGNSVGWSYSHFLGRLLEPEIAARRQRVVARNVVVEQSNVRADQFVWFITEGAAGGGIRVNDAKLVINDVDTLAHAFEHLGFDPHLMLRMLLARHVSQQDADFKRGSEVSQGTVN